MKRIWVGCLLVAMLILTGCEHRQEVLHFEVRDHQYTLTPAKLIERSTDPDVEARFGVISDLHVNSSLDNLKKLVAKLRERDVDLL